MVLLPLASALAIRARDGGDRGTRGLVQAATLVKFVIAASQGALCFIVRNANASHATNRGRTNKPC